MKNNLPEYYCRLTKLNLRRLKAEKGWKTKEMSIQTGVSEGYLNSLLSMAVAKVPTIYILGIICEKANVEIGYFFVDN